MNSTAKVKKIYPPETFAFEDGRTYTQQLIILDCGEYNRSTGDYYENDIPVYFGERNLDKLAGVTEGAKVEVQFGLKGRAYTYTTCASSTTINATAATSPDASPHGSFAPSTTSDASKRNGKTSAAASTTTTI